MSLRFPFPALAALSLAATLLCAEEIPSLTVGPDSTIVQEWRTIPLKRGEQEIELAGLPAEADISSLQIRLKRRELPVLSWSAEDAPPQTHFSRRGGNAVWSRDVPAAEKEGPRRMVRCRVDSPSSGKLELQLVYLVSNITWSASYQAAVRGELADDQPVSVDLWSKILLENGTSLSFDHARLYLAGPAPRSSDPKPPGFLMLNDESPLSDLWKPPRAKPDPQYVYAVPDPVQISPGQTDIAFLTTERLPSRPVYRMTSDAVPVSSRRRGWPLELLLILRNGKSSGLGLLLPPGPVDIHRGGLWGPLIDRGWLPHTPVDGEIRISLGESDDVLGWRRDLGRARADVDAWYLDYEVEIRNLRNSSVTVEVEEIPPVPLSWNLISSTENYVRRAGMLRFRQELPGDSRHSIEYRLQVREAEL
ncbi:MAG: hypothetical protein AB7T27_11660 [Kiritimatiellia bacterium]